MIGNFFCTPIYKETFVNKDLISAEINKALSVASFANDWQPDNDTANTTFKPNESTNVIKELDMNLVEAEILKHSYNYLEKIEYSIVNGSLNIFTSWLNTFDRDQLIGLHEHGYQPNTFSGCYYHTAPKNSGCIQFKSTNPFVVSFPHASPIYSNLLNVDPEEGMILLFPSWLMHKVLPNKSQERRVSLAFNLEFEQRR